MQRNMLQISAKISNSQHTTISDLFEQSTVKLHDVRTIGASFDELQLSQQLFLLFLVHC